MFRQKSLLTRAVATLLLLLLASACVEESETGVALQNVRADIVFGVKEPLGPANFLAPGERIEDTVQFGSDLPSSPTQRRGAAPRTAPPACPSASRTAAAPEEAPTNARGVPTEGAYNWKYDGTQEVASIKGLKFKISGFERRTVRAIGKISDTEFRFTTFQSDLQTKDIVATRYKVKTEAAAARAPQTTTRAGEPDRGMAIERIDHFDPRTGNTKDTFVPNPPVLLVPLPILVGEEFQSLGVDPVTRERLQVQGVVKNRQFVDACGELIDGWTVEMNQTSTSPEGVEKTRKYTMIVATQKGAIPIGEFVEAEDPDGKISVNFTIAQTKADPIK